MQRSSSQPTLVLPAVLDEPRRRRTIALLATLAALCALLVPATQVLSATPAHAASLFTCSGGTASGTITDPTAGLFLSVVDVTGTGTVTELTSCTGAGSSVPTGASVSGGGTGSGNCETLTTTTGSVTATITWTGVSAPTTSTISVQAGELAQVNSNGEAVVEAKITAGRYIGTLLNPTLVTFTIPVTNNVTLTGDCTTGVHGGSAPNVNMLLTNTL